MSSLIVIILLTVGIYFILKGLLRCPPPQVVTEYKFVPRTFKEEQENPVSIVNLFDKMFQEDSIYR